MDRAPGLTADVSALWDEGVGTASETAPQVISRTLGGAQPRRQNQAGRAGRRRAGAAGVTVKTALKCAMTRDGVAQTECVCVCGGESPSGVSPPLLPARRRRFSNPPSIGVRPSECLPRGSGCRIGVAAPPTPPPGLCHVSIGRTVGSKAIRNALTKKRKNKTFYARPRRFRCGGYLC